MLVITFLQQEFLILSEWNDLDIVGEEIKADVLERFQRMRWLLYLIPTVVLLLRLFLVSLCLFIGSFFFSEMSGRQFKDWWGVAIMAQSVKIIYSVSVCISNLAFRGNLAEEFSKNTSLLFLGNSNLEPWVRLPLTAVNVFEILYWGVMSLFVGKLCGTTFGKSFKFVMSTYGVGYLFYIALLMFLMLYLT